MPIGKWRRAKSPQGIVWHNHASGETLVLKENNNGYVLRVHTPGNEPNMKLTTGTNKKQLISEAADYMRDNKRDKHSCKRVKPANNNSVRRRTIGGNNVKCYR